MAQSMFKIPLSPDSDQFCNVSKGTAMEDLLKRVKLVIWDEVPMQHKNVIMAVERTLRDIRGSESLFGGLPVVFGGDFAQILPVVPNAQRPGIVDACIQCTTFWRELSVLRLTENIRLPPDVRNQTWAWWIKNMSYDERMYGEVALPPEVSSDKQFVDDESFLEHVYPLAELQDPNRSETYFMDRAVLAPHNESVTNLNDKVLTYLPGDVSIHHSVDSSDVNDDSGIHVLAAETMAMMEIASLPQEVIRLKLRAPIMLMRNLSPRVGLCNGTRGIVQRVTNYVVMIKIIGGNFDGNVHAIPRLMLSSIDGELPYTTNRKQFPVRLSFAMSINKAQGQSLKYVGVDLRRPCFSHGQLYVALSRVTDVDRLSTLWKEDNSEQKTMNIVCSEVLFRDQLNFDTTLGLSLVH